MDLCDDLQYQIVQYLYVQEIFKILKKTNFPFAIYAKNIPIFDEFYKDEDEYCNDFFSQKKIYDT